MERSRNYDRTSNENFRGKIANDTDFGSRKTLLILAIVGGCFIVLWPKIFYPMIIGPGNSISLPTDGSVCCDLIFESDVNTVDILQEMCKNILKHHQVDPRVRDAVKINKLSPQSASFCRDEVLARCGIDLSSFLAEKERLGKTNKQVLEEIRSFNSSICLKVHFGVPLSQLGIPHLIRYHILMPHTPLRQERSLPPHAGGLHPAMRERGRAIPTSHIVPRVEGRPDHVITQKMRPPMGGPGRVMPPQGGGGTMGIIMPLYTIGILLFFVYTIAKILRKNSNNEIYPEHIRVEAEKEFRDRVFNPEVLTSAIAGMPYYRQRKSQSPVRHLPTVEELRQRDIEVDQLIQRLADTEAAMERIVVQMGNLSRTVKQNPSTQADIQGEDSDKKCCGIENNIHDELDESSPTVKIMGMETTASCEGGQKISRPTTPIIPHSHSNVEREKTPPKPIYLEGALPSQCELLVTDSETQAENIQEDADAAVVLSGKMTLSLISLDQIPASCEETNGNIEDDEEEIAKIVPENPEEIFLKQNGDVEVIQERNDKEIDVDDINEDEKMEEEEEEEEDEDEEVTVSEEEEGSDENLQNDEQDDAISSDDSDEVEEVVNKKNVQVKNEMMVKAKNDENIENEDEDDENDEEEEEEEGVEDDEEEEEEEEEEDDDEDEDDDTDEELLNSKQ
ncbi:hypothetical protein PV325_000682 [Microctonus aethiopoides]|nr:hypothetical protein PV325_000682 [Microctonus aethiopoides]